MAVETLRGVEVSMLNKDSREYPPLRIHGETSTTASSSITFYERESCRCVQSRALTSSGHWWSECARMIRRLGSRLAQLKTSSLGWPLVRSQESLPTKCQASRVSAIIAEMKQLATVQTTTSRNCQVVHRIHDLLWDRLDHLSVWIKGGSHGDLVILRYTCRVRRCLTHSIIELLLLEDTQGPPVAKQPTLARRHCRLEPP